MPAATPTPARIAVTTRQVKRVAEIAHGGITKQAVAFYATRDTNPERWYPVAADGSVLKFDDLPEKYRDNIDVEPPFNKKRGGTPAMSERDIMDIVAYLDTLTDGYVLPRSR